MAKKKHAEKSKEAAKSAAKKAAKSAANLEFNMDFIGKLKTRLAEVEARLQKLEETVAIPSPTGTPTNIP